MIALTLTNISKTYAEYSSEVNRVLSWFGFNVGSKKEHLTLNDINLIVNKGESIGIIGENGAGKSTLLKIISGVISPSSGEVKTNGKIAAILELGMGFTPEMTGRQNSYYTAYMMGYSKQQVDEQIENIKAFSEIGDFFEQNVSTYSSGMIVRVAFAVATMFNPEILIIDEALAVGDIYFQAKCFQHIREKLQAATKILVSHDLDAVIQTATRVLVVDGGQIIFDGNPVDAVEYYLKLVHSKLYNNKESLIEFSEVVSHKEENQHMMAVPQKKLSGLLGVRIDDFEVEIDGYKNLQQVTSGQKVTIRWRGSVVKKMENIIFGYFLRDRFGKQLFGNNTEQIMDYTLFKGKAELSMSFTWPEIEPGIYQLTLGVGQMSRTGIHEVQCWAHNIFSFRCTTSSTQFHGLFNSDIYDVVLKDI